LRFSFPSLACALDRSDFHSTLLTHFFDELLTLKHEIFNNHRSIHRPADNFSEKDKTQQKP